MFWSPSKWIASPYPLRWQMSLPRPLQISQTKGATLKMKTDSSCMWPSADTQGPHHPLQSTGKWKGGLLQLDPYGCIPVLQ